MSSALKVTLCDPLVPEPRGKEGLGVEGPHGLVSPATEGLSPATEGSSPATEGSSSASAQL